METTGFEHRHFYLKTGEMGGWHDAIAKHPLDATAHEHPTETRLASLKATRERKPTLTAEQAAYAAEWLPGVENPTALTIDVMMRNDAEAKAQAVFDAAVAVEVSRQLAAQAPRLDSVGDANDMLTIGQRAHQNGKRS